MTDPEPTLPPTLPRVLLLMWGQPAARRPGPKPTFTISDIATAAVGVADADGLAAVSMGRVAHELGFTTMSLYRYVDSKDDLYAVMLDHAYGQPELPVTPDVGWRDQLAQWSQANREVLLAHPWVLQVPFAEPPLGPNQIAWMEAGLRALARTPLSAQARLSSMLLVDVYIRGQTQLANGIGPTTPSGQGTPSQYAWRLSQLIDRERFPQMWGAMASGSLEDDDSDLSDEFAFGLTTVLDGIEMLVSRADAIPND
jgi:AcrR family transcriptional regulator